MIHVALHALELALLALILADLVWLLWRKRRRGRS